MGQRLRWNVTAVYAPVETGSAQLSPATVRTHTPHTHIHTHHIRKRTPHTYTHTGVSLSPVSGTDRPEVVEAEGAEQEMTEEEWTRRVAELNMHQVWIGTYTHTHTHTHTHT